MITDMEELRKVLSSWNISISEEKLDLFNHYYEELILWNSRINLTSITDKDDVILKHFADSIALLKYMDLSCRTILDVGTGAGFPGIPLCIMCEDCDITLMDSLNKRVSFLNHIIDDLGLSNIRAVHGRAEDLGHDPNYRERFDVVTSRAVANLCTLSEYSLPFVKINGMFVSYKSGNVSDEISEASESFRVLGGTLSETVSFVLPHSDITRTFVFIKKVNNTPDRFPRKAGLPSKKPIK